MQSSPVMQKLATGRTGNAGTSCAGAWRGQLAYIKPYWWNGTRTWHIRTCVIKLEKRFRFRELPDTAKEKFNNARQAPDELLGDWADRILPLATRAFGDLPKHHMYQQAVVRSCQGRSR